MAHVAKYVPTFVLKGVTLEEIVKKYRSGYFSRSVEEANLGKQKIKLARKMELLAPIYGSSNDDAMFTIRDKNNRASIFVTTNNKGYECFKLGVGTLPRGGRCKNCLSDFTEEIIGYPIHYEEKLILVGDKYKIYHYFWVVGCFCTFECALNYIVERHLTEFEQFLRFLYRLVYPNSGQLIKANDGELLDINHGPLTREQWLDKKHVYIRTKKIVMLPSKEEYIRQDVRK